MHKHLCILHFQTLMVYEKIHIKHIKYHISDLKGRIRMQSSNFETTTKRKSSFIFQRFPYFFKKILLWKGNHSCQHLSYICLYYYDLYLYIALQFINLFSPRHLMDPTTLWNRLLFPFYMWRNEAQKGYMSCSIQLLNVRT